ncbi:hypothetical protein N7478_000036 [Penicillium angulare]|uniref:uncharacterized protein n=1 Tax=Penicillium angulare TaxID=116970 RepID=UPI00254102EA|nr:uncharacterized protein N7478_000036 [Penicillium angulare]KAJ5290785.1 hypothetical protein N7478_000036 [Penicillium angulare]
MASATLRPDWPPDKFSIKRKPLSNPNLRQTANVQSSGALGHAATSPALVAPSPTHISPYIELYKPRSQLQVPETPIARPRSAGEISTVKLSTEQPPPTPVRKAYGEACHFLGGLINHPTESNRHVTILRHSHGLVFYRGNTTSVAVSIFSDAPLPLDRTLWLQSKGWSGKTGMRTKALLNLRDSWINVTPTLPLHANQTNPDDERAWQRDIKKFRKKAPARPRDYHHLRETAVVRIPSEAGDGYFQIVLCQGLKKKVLGNSPVFRVLSTSASPSSLRGASLSTLPLELGAMIASLYAQTAAKAVISPASSAVKSKVNPYRPAWLTQTAAQTAYSASGAQSKVAGITTGLARPPGKVSIEEEVNPVTFENGFSSIELGPQPPFPMSFKARADTSCSKQHAITGDNLILVLNKVPDWVTQQLRGYFFGWARFDIGTSKESTSGPWSAAILSIRTVDPLQAARVDMAKVANLVAQLRLLDDVPIETTKVETRIMGFLRVDVPPPIGKTSQELVEAQATAAEAGVLAESYDEFIVQNTLAHIAWSPDSQSHGNIQRQDSGWIERTKEGYTDIRNRGQKWVEQVPLHRLGVRSATDQVRERQVAVNGFYIVR